MISLCTISNYKLVNPLYLYLYPSCDRENKFVIKASEHIQRTAQKFTDEDALMTACFHTLTDDVVEHERRAARMHLYRWDKCDIADQELRHDLDIEGGIRTEEDVELLDTIVETQQLLQKTVHNIAINKTFSLFAGCVCICG